MARAPRASSSCVATSTGAPKDTARAVASFEAAWLTERTTLSIDARENAQMCWAYAALFVCRSLGSAVMANARARADVDATMVRRCQMEWCGTQWTSHTVRALLVHMDLASHANRPDDPTLVLFRLLGVPDETCASVDWCYSATAAERLLLHDVVALIRPTSPSASQSYRPGAVDAHHWIAVCRRDGGAAWFDSLGGGEHIADESFFNIELSAPGMAYVVRETTPRA
jgi:hypothetical protein